MVVAASLFSSSHALIAFCSILRSGFFNNLNAAVFFCPLVAAIINQRMAGSLHMGLTFTWALIRMHAATIVSNGKKINSNGQPMASDKAVQRPTSGSDRMQLKSRQCDCAL